MVRDQSISKHDYKHPEENLCLMTLFHHLFGGENKADPTSTVQLVYEITDFYSSITFNKCCYLATNLCSCVCNCTSYIRVKCFTWGIYNTIQFIISFCYNYFVHPINYFIFCFKRT